MTYLHFGGASTSSVVVTVVTIFFLMFAMSFAVGPVPEGKKRFSREWISAWLKASLPRMLVAGAFAGGLYVASSMAGNSQNAAQGGNLACNGSIPPLSSQPVTQARIDSAAEQLAAVSDAAAAGDVNFAQTLFFGETHNLTHDIDGPLREANRELAVKFCDNVVILEMELPRGTNLGTIQTAAADASRQLEDARDSLSGLP